MKAIWMCTMLVLLVCGLGAVLNGFGQGIVETDVVIKIAGKPIPVQRAVIQKVKVALPSVDGDVKTLVRHYGLNEKPKRNPDLAFGANEIRYWNDKHLDRKTLKLEFAARRIVLDAADKQNVAIRDQDMLATAAREVIPYLRGAPPTPTPQAPPTAGPPTDQNPDVPCLICGCPVGVTSQDLIKKAWDALNANNGGMDPKNLEKALACTKVTIARFAGDADEQQSARLLANECKKTPTPQEKDAYFASYWALSDIGAAWFIRGQVFEQQRNCTEAKEAYQTIIAKYNCAYIWDPRGWFWNASKGADQALKNLETNGCR